VNVDDLKIDVLSISAHKLYGPKGIGAIYVRRKPRVRLEPIINGGGQERGLRSGTVAAPLVVGFGEAARLARKEMSVRSLFRFCFQSSFCFSIWKGTTEGVMQETTVTKTSLSLLFARLSDFRDCRRLFETIPRAKQLWHRKDIRAGVPSRYSSVPMSCSSD